MSEMSGVMTALATWGSGELSDGGDAANWDARVENAEGVVGSAAATLVTDSSLVGPLAIPLWTGAFVTVLVTTVWPLAGLTADGSCILSPGDMSNRGLASKGLLTDMDVC